MRKLAPAVALFWAVAGCISPDPDSEPVDTDPHQFVGFDPAPAIDLDDPRTVLAEWTTDKGELMRLVDETPDAEQPSIGLVTVTPPGAASDLEILDQLEATPLEIFLAYRGDKSPVPARILLDNEMRTRAGLAAARPRELPVHISYAVEEVPSSDCYAGNIFDLFHLNFNLWRQSKGLANYQVPAQIFDDAVTTGNFAKQDYILASVCTMSNSATGVHARIEIQSGGNWTTVAGSQVYVNPGNRYRYSNLTLCNNKNRRLYVFNGANDKYRIAGAWDERCIVGPGSGLGQE
ncbi:MAG: hypothetical protein MJE77_06715 [Proteobacteria bacterium]|nr:hypothetical protein [Pseudomonadota bacterium]